MVWLIKSATRVQGPFTPAQVRELVDAGRLGSGMLLSPDGGASWLGLEDALAALDGPAGAGLAPAATEPTELPASCPACAEPIVGRPIRCSHCGHPLRPGMERSETAPVVPGPPGLVPDYFLVAVLLSLCCCHPIGLWAVVLATQANTLARFGQIEEAEAKASQAGWLIALILVGVVVMVIIGVIAEAGP